jgi:hypothetical protein
MYSTSIISTTLNSSPRKGRSGPASPPARVDTNDLPSYDYGRLVLFVRATLQDVS